MRSRFLIATVLLAAAHTVAAAKQASNQLIVPRGSAQQILIPAAGSVAGANGTFFRTDATIINYRLDQSQSIALTWIPQGSSAVGATRTITINPASGIASEDFVGEIMGTSGLGAILMTPVTGDGAPDSAAQLFATARIWTNQPGSSGTVSQSFPTIATADIDSTQLSIAGQRRDDRYRANVGVINLDSDLTQTFQITVGGTSPGFVTENVVVALPPMSMTQVSLPGPSGPVLQVLVTNITAGGHTLWTAYGSSVDNTTGDGWSSLGFSAPVPAHNDGAP